MQQQLRTGRPEHNSASGAQAGAKVAEAGAEANRIALVVPVYNDWSSFDQLINDIDKHNEFSPVKFHIIAVDDGSTERRTSEYHSGELRRIEAVEIVELVCNLGHQRAIAVGLVCAAALPNIDAVIVMDSDGEDRPAEIRYLIAAAAANPNAVICAQRAQRSEGRSFRAFYRIYRLCFRVLTGATIDFGNFCLIPKSLLRYVVSNGNTWNNLAAMLVRSRLPCIKVPTVRGRRYAGRSKMNLISLILHGLSAIAVYCDVALARLLIFMISLSGLALCGVIVASGLRFLTELAIPGWASNVVGSFLIILLQSLVFSVISIFLLLHSRSSRMIIPSMDALNYVGTRTTLVMKPASLSSAS